jgi:hypothetical protein
MWDEVTYLVVRRAIRNERLDPGRLLLNAQQCNLRFEILHRSELAIDAREAEVCDLVQLAERTEDCNSNFIGRYFGLAQGPQRIFDQLSQTGELVLADRPSLACFPNAVDHLVAIERLDDSAAFHYNQLHLLDGGEPPLTGWALPPAADTRPIVSRPRIEHFGIGVATVRAVHVRVLPSCSTLPVRLGDRSGDDPVRLLGDPVDLTVDFCE